MSVIDGAVSRGGPWMSREELQRQRLALDVVARAAGVAEGEREAFVRMSCGADAALEAVVRALLVHAADPAAPLRTGVGCGGEVASGAGAWCPERIDGCRVVRRVGEGGMGVVFEAEQASPRRRVAVKALRPGLVTGSALLRFQLESSALAILDHPGIARVYSTGVGREGTLEYPYFVMEYVEGRPIAGVMDGSRSSRRRSVELMVQVCEAVHHAHQRGVIHRDLKPSNILVDEQGRVRIVDFGVARLLPRSPGVAGLEVASGVTQAGEFVGTPAYMSPEQAAGDRVVDTRTDVYAIGAVLFELLAGVSAHRLTGLHLGPALREVRDAETPRLASVDRGLRGDLDAIVGKAMARDPERRYGSTAELRDDLKRYLEGMPVAARSPGVVYRAVKWGRRNRWVVAAGVAVSAAVVMGARTALLSVERSRQDVKKSQAAMALVADVIQMGRQPWGHEIDRKQAARLIAMAGKVVDVFPDQPLTEARLCEMIGAPLVWSTAEGRACAEKLLQRSMELRRRELGEVGALAESEGLAPGNLARLLAEKGRFEEAEALQLAVIDALRNRGGHEARIAVVRHYAGLANILTSRGRIGSALWIWEEAEQLHAEATGGEEFPLVWRIFRLNTLGESGDRERFEREAAAMLRECDGREDVPSDVRTTIRLMQARMGMSTGETLAAEEFTSGDERFTRGSYHEVSPLLMKAGMLWAKGELAEAEPLFREAVERLRAKGVGDRRLADALNSHGVCLRDLGRYVEAEAVLREVMRVRQEIAEPESAVVAQTALNLAKLLRKLGRVGEAVPLAEQAERILGRQPGGKSVESIEARAFLGLVVAEVRGLEAGRPLLEAALAERNASARSSWQADYAAEAMGEALALGGQIDRACALLAEDHRSLLSEFGAGNLVTVRAAARLERFERQRDGEGKTRGNGPGGS